MSSSIELTGSQRIARSIGVGLGKLPPNILRILSGGSQTNQAGNVMAPEIGLLMKMAAAGPDFSDQPAARARESVDAETATFAANIPSLNLVQHVTIKAGLRAVRYRATDSSKGLLLYFHGGGFVFGNCAAYDSPARLLAVHTGLDVLSVDYRLAPDHPFPAPIDDAFAAWEYAVAQSVDWGVDPHRIVVAGDSAGGNIAAVLAQQLRYEDVRPAVQALLYPTVDFAGEYRSQIEFADSPALTRKQIDWFQDQYIPAGADRRDPRLSPSCADDVSGLPSIVITVAGFDPLRDEAVAYAERLSDAGVPTRLLREDGLVHGFVSFTAISKTSLRASVRFAEAITEALADVHAR
ncbi:alpha/beta hydrolase [Rhodococcus daqingensis]|uniref:Alpha/beta hydrolase n=1 Tax=Rhodococcus daqingensis TaxID=2479363 RepID=A0ABW2RTU1_9NOCA